MSLYICSKCGCVENTAASNFWNRGDGPALCSECDPEIGRWHGMFEKRRPEEAAIVDRSGELMHRDRAAMIDAMDAYFQVPLPEHIDSDVVARLSFEAGWNRGVEFMKARADGTP